MRSMIQRIYLELILTFHTISDRNVGIVDVVYSSLQKKIQQMQEQSKQTTAINQKPPLVLSIAPMIDISNTHFRYFIRLITHTAPVYTEMLHHDAVIHSHGHLLPFNKQQHPIVLQLGGSDPEKLAQAAILGEKYGYDSINLNVGCPSPRVQKGSFGACLMKQPQLVKECMLAMSKAVKIPCTVKCRLGVDEFDSYEFARDFVSEVSNKGKGPITHFIIHARKAFLKGLNPAQNRNIPPLMYDRVYRLKEEFPMLTFELNGGIKSVEKAYLYCSENKLEGCMVGRLAYENPFELMRADQFFSNYPNYRKTYENDAIARKQILTKYAGYIEKLQNGQIKDEFGHPIRKPNPSVLVKPIINWYNGQKFSGKYRQYLSDLVKLKEGPLHLVIRKAVELMWDGGFRTKWKGQPKESAQTQKQQKLVKNESKQESVEQKETQAGQQ